MGIMHLLVISLGLLQLLLRSFGLHRVVEVLALKLEGVELLCGDAYRARLDGLTCLHGRGWQVGWLISILL